MITPEDYFKKYDPVKAHAYYERTKKLKGRKKVSTITKSRRTSSKPKPLTPAQLKMKAAKERVGRLQGKVNSIRKSLSEVQAELVQKRHDAVQANKKNSDGKTTAKERAQSQAYRDKNQTKIAQKAKATAKSGGTTSTSTSKAKIDSRDSIRQLETKERALKGLLKEANRQLSVAQNELGSLVHTAILLDPNSENYFAHFQSAERIPS